MQNKWSVDKVVGPRTTQLVVDVLARLFTEPTKKLNYNSESHSLEFIDGAHVHFPKIIKNYDTTQEILESGVDESGDFADKNDGVAYVD